MRSSPPASSPAGLQPSLSTGSRPIPSNRASGSTTRRWRRWRRPSPPSGLLQPVVVRALGDDRYELIAGERRCRAARMAGPPGNSFHSQGHDEPRCSLTEALVENLQREDLGALEEAAAYRQLIDDFGMTHDEVGVAVGRSRSTVSNTVRLLQLPAPVHRLLEEGALTAGHARALLGLDDAGLRRPHRRPRRRGGLVGPAGRGRRPPAHPAGWSVRSPKPRNGTARRRSSSSRPGSSEHLGHPGRHRARRQPGAGWSSGTARSTTWSGSTDTSSARFSSPWGRSGGGRCSGRAEV